MAAELQGISQTELVGRIKAADTEAIAEFYRRFIRGLMYFLRRQGVHDGDIEDLAHDTIFLVVRGIQKGGLKNPECLAGFVRTIAMRQVYARWEEAARVATIPDESVFIWDRPRLNAEQQAIAEKFSTGSGLSPEQQALAKEKSTIFRQALGRLKPKEVEILTRFYLNEQPPQAIEAEMGMTETQFRLNKSRAKGKLAKEVARISSALPIPPIQPDRENLAA